MASALLYSPYCLLAHNPSFTRFFNFLLFSPSSSVFSLVQLVLSFTFLKCGCFSLRPVSNTATFTPDPTQPHNRGVNFLQSDIIWENKASRVLVAPVCPICQRTSAWRIWATWRGIARSRRRLEWRPVACQKPEPRDKLVRRKGRDDCHDCHFCVLVLALHGAVGSAASGTEQKRLQYAPCCPLLRCDPIHNYQNLGVL